MSMRSPAPSLGKVEFLVLLWTTFAALPLFMVPSLCCRASSNISGSAASLPVCS